MRWCLLNRSGNMILLCDPEGLVIDQVGDPYTLDMGRENHLHTGGRWREEDIGTNAIGMALLTGMPVQVFRAEHFSEEIQRWSCSATPVCDPVTERILGVVDVSWPADALRSDASALFRADRSGIWRHAGLRIAGPNRPFEIRWKGLSLPYRIFDPTQQRVTHAAITENKRLGDVLAFIKAQQEANAPQVGPVGKQRTRYTPTGKRGGGNKGWVERRAERRAAAALPPVE